MRPVAVCTLVTVSCIAAAAAATPGRHGADEWTLLEGAYWDGGRIVLTADELDQVGSAWFNKPIDLRQDFGCEFRIYLGSKDEDGADGIAFVLAPDMATGYLGQGLGYQELAPSLAVELDCYPNNGEHEGEDYGDPLADHVAICLHGVPSHQEVILPAAEVENLEDGAERVFRVHWSASEKTLRVYLDEARAPVLTYEADIVEDVFYGESEVLFGFTGATGIFSNLQYVIPVIVPHEVRATDSVTGSLIRQAEDESEEEVEEQEDKK